MNSLRKQSKRGLSLSVQKNKKRSLPKNNLQDISDFTISKQNSICQKSIRNSLYKNSFNQQQKQKMRKFSLNHLSQSLFSNKDPQTKNLIKNQQKRKILQTDLILGGPKKNSKNNIFYNSLSQTFNCLKVIKQNNTNKSLNSSCVKNYFKNTNSYNSLQYIPIQDQQVDHKQNIKPNFKMTYSLIRNCHINMPYSTQYIETKKDGFFPSYTENENQSNNVLEQYNQKVNNIKVAKSNKNISKMQINNQNWINQKENKKYQNLEIKISPPVLNGQNLQYKQSKNKKRTSIFKDKLTQIQKKLDSLIISAKNTRKQIQQRVQQQNVIS